MSRRNRLVPRSTAFKGQLDAGFGSATLAFDMRGRTGIWLLGMCVIALFALVIFLFRAPPPPTPLPSPNGFDDFLKASQSLVSTVPFVPAPSHDQLRTMIAATTQTLELLRLGLSRDCRFPADRFLTNAVANLQTLYSLKKLAQLLEANGRLAELDGRTNDAIASYVDAIKFGNEISRGGFMVNRLVGIACENIGQTPLIRLTPTLSPEQARHLTSALEAIDARPVSWDEVTQNDKAFIRHAYRHNSSPLFLIAPWLNRDYARKGKARHDRVRATLRLLIAELAVRGCTQEKGQPPRQLHQLVPEYMKAVPQDPYSGQPLVYRVQGTNWLLYSIALDGVDNGGVRQTNRGDPPPGTDLFYDSLR